MTASIEFLVGHGVTAALTRCRDPHGLTPGRGDRVVFRGPRGLELGEVLCPAPDDAPSVARTVAAGELLRRATTDDETRADSWQRRGTALLDDAQAQITEHTLPLTALDVEILLDGSRAFVHILRWDACSLTPLAERLLAGHGVPVSFQDRSVVAEEPHDHHGGCGDGGCGDGGCGSGGGGCSTGKCGSGSCSSGSVKSADELTAYFAGLREQMWHAQERVPLA